MKHSMKPVGHFKGTFSYKLHKEWWFDTKQFLSKPENFRTDFNETWINFNEPCMNSSIHEAQK